MSALIRSEKSAVPFTSSQLYMCHESGETEDDSRRTVQQSRHFHEPGSEKRSI
jgi:hypothetical protein